MNLAHDFYELNVYQKAFEVQQKIFEITKSFPREELYSLSNQIRRSSRSIAANISEAWAKRPYPAHFCSKLTDSEGELNETRHWLYTAFRCEYINQESMSSLNNELEEIKRMLVSMVHKADSWCKPHH